MKNIPQRFTEKDKVWISIMHLVAWVCLKMVNTKGHVEDLIRLHTLKKSEYVHQLCIYLEAWVCLKMVNNEGHVE